MWPAGVLGIEKLEASPSSIDLSGRKKPPASATTVTPTNSNLERPR